MQSALRWRIVLVVLVLAGSASLVATRPARLGLDLQGGTQVVLEAKDTDRVRVDGDTTARIVEVLRRRVDALGVAEPTLQRSGDRRVIVELPGLDNPDQAVEVIGRTAQLAFHPVESYDIATTTMPGEPGAEGEEPEEAGPGADGTLVLPDESGTPLVLGPARLTGEAVAGAQAVIEPTVGAWQVEVEFRGGGSQAWADLTGEAACAAPGDPARRIAIVLDTDVISSPAVSTSIACGQGITGGRTVITGNFTQSEAKQLALLIRAGALPVPVEIVEQRTIGPTLGEAAIDASMQAAIIGAALTVLFLLAYYRLLGLVAAVALGVYGLISFAVLLGIGATLTLPGIAGFVLAIGMAVDANVLVFERTKDEHISGRSPRTAMRNGFKGAWSAIADSNATTLIAAMLLFFFASGAVRGFGVTLSIGVVVSMFTALVVTRVLLELLLRGDAMGRRPRLLGLHVGSRFRAWLERRRPDILHRSKLWLSIAAAVGVLAVIAVAGRGLTFGLDFAGGRLVEYDTERPVDPDRLRPALADLGLPRAIVQESGEGNVSVRATDLTDDQEAGIQEVVERLGGTTTVVRDEFVGPTIGGELRRKALIALALALAAQLTYLAVRFRWTYGTAAVVAMFHDVAVLIGVFAALGKTIDGVFLASLLTVIGYSINDSVVVFDRIREQRRARAKEPLEVVANDACLQTVPRTINTGLGALFILGALYALGGESLTDFALALIIGIVTGTYSSVFVAAPVAVALEGRWPSARSRAATPGKPASRPPTARQPAGSRSSRTGSRSKPDMKIIR
jgi:SecD/SecF fusion protein